MPANPSKRGPRPRLTRLSPTTLCWCDCLSARRCLTLVQAVLKEAATDKKVEQRAVVSQDEDELIDSGKALSQEDRDTLQAKLEEFLSQPVPLGTAAATTAAAGASEDGLSKKDALQWQAHFLTYILN